MPIVRFLVVIAPKELWALAKCWWCWWSHWKGHDFAEWPDYPVGKCKRCGQWDLQGC